MPEERAQIGKYPLENTNTQAARHFSKVLSRKIIQNQLQEDWRLSTYEHWLKAKTIEKAWWWSAYLRKNNEDLYSLTKILIRQCKSTLKQREQQTKLWTLLLSWQPLLALHALTISRLPNLKFANSLWRPICQIYCSPNFSTICYMKLHTIGIFLQCSSSTTFPDTQKKILHSPLICAQVINLKRTYTNLSQYFCCCSFFEREICQLRSSEASGSTKCLMQLTMYKPEENEYHHQKYSVCWITIRDV